MSSESVCQVAHSWVDVSSFHPRLFEVMYFAIASVREFPDTPSHLSCNSLPMTSISSLHSVALYCTVTAVTNFRLNTGHDCLAAHLHCIKFFNHNYCTICQLVNTAMDKDHLLVCPKLDHISNELPKLYWDARRLME
jgi:hypothetical protein